MSAIAVVPGSPKNAISRPVAVVASLAVGMALSFVLRLQPVWWMAWFAPALLLVLAFRAPAKDVPILVTLSAIVALAPNIAYFATVMAWPAAVLVVCLQALLWRYTVLLTRRVVLRYRAAWTVFVFPLVWVTADMLMARFLPDGNWGSVAYSQSEFLPILQLLSVAGVPGVLFLLMLFASALAMAIAPVGTVRHSRRTLIRVALLTAAFIGMGSYRMREPPAGEQVTFGLVAIDDAIGRTASASYSGRIRDQYDAHVASLAASGAQIVVLPEKVAVLSDTQADEWRVHFSDVAKRHRVSLEVGVAVDSAGGRRNYSWVFDSAGQLAVRYHKHYMAPPERGDVPGSLFEVHRIGAQRYGVAICKDMHFATLGRAYGLLDADVMLVPAWDFGRDAWLGARMTVVRGVESGYVVVRSARDGLLTVSDAYGRVIAERASAPMPGATLLVRTVVPLRVATIYGRIGDAFGWSCVAAFGALLLTTRGKEHANIGA